MTYQEVEKLVLNTIKTKFNTEATQYSNLAKDFAFDSLDMTELTIEIQNVFKIYIPENVQEELVYRNPTVNRITEYICQQKKVPIPSMMNQPIELHTVDDTTFQFRQGNRVLSINDPKISHYMEILHNELAKQK